MKYEIWAKGHEGVVSVEDEKLGEVEAESSKGAIQKFAALNNDKISWIPAWNRFGFGIRELFTKTKPTDIGIKKYPPNGVYEDYPCICKPECPYDCKGKCGCKACSAAYSDFLSFD